MKCKNFHKSTESYILGTFCLLLLKGTNNIVYGQGFLRRAAIGPDKKKKLGFWHFFYFFLRHGKKILSFFHSIGSISVIKYLNISDKNKMLPTVFIFLFFPTSDKPKSPLSESVDHRIYCMCPKGPGGDQYFSFRPGIFSGFTHNINIKLLE